MSSLRQLFPVYGTAVLLLLGAAPTPSASGQATKGKATATPEQGLPDGWQELPALADRARAAAETAADEGFELEIGAWGDPASGVFALDAKLATPTGGSGFADLPPALRAEAEAAGAEIADWRLSHGVADFAFEWRAFRGTARVRSRNAENDDGVRARLLACFYTGRQPSRSAQACRRVMESFEEMP